MFSWALSCSNVPLDILENECIHPRRLLRLPSAVNSLLHGGHGPSRFDNHGGLAVFKYLGFGSEAMTRSLAKKACYILFRTHSLAAGNRGCFVFLALTRSPMYPARSRR
jgi:hypothetical protein